MEKSPFLDTYPVEWPTCRKCGEPIENPVTMDRRFQTCSVCRAYRTVPVQGAWVDRAACSVDDPELQATVHRWFFEGAVGQKPTRARRVCDRCPVKEECLAYALADPSLVGIWAGTTERERQRMRKERGRVSTESVA